MNDYEELSKQLCDAHWSYIKALLDSHDIVDNEKRTAEFHYKSAFKHGFKHGVEYMEELYRESN